VIDRGRIVADGTPAELRARVPSGRLDDFFRSVTRSDLEPDAGLAAQQAASSASQAASSHDERVAS